MLFVKKLKRTFNNYGFTNSAEKQWIKYIIKVIGPLENRSVSLKRTAGKISCQEGWLPNFLGTLMSTEWNVYLQH